MPISLPDEIEEIDVGINESTNLIYATDDSSSIIVIDGNPASPTFHEIIAQSGYMGGSEITINEVTNRIYVLVSGIGFLVFDGVSNSPVQIISTGKTGYHLSFDSVGNRLWVAHSSTNGIKLMDAATENMTSLNLGNPAFGVLFNPNTNRAYAVSVDITSWVITVIYGESLETEAVITPAKPFRGLAMNNLTHRLFILEENQVEVIEGDPDSPDFNKVIATVPAGLDAAGIAVNEKTNRIYVGQESDDDLPSTVHVIDDTTNTLETTITVGVGADQIAVNRITNRVYTSNDESDSISVIDADPLSENFHTVIETIPLASNPEYLLVNEATNRLYVNVDENSTVAVIDGSTNSVEAVIQLPEGSEEVKFALDMGLNRIYACDEQRDVVYVIDANPVSSQFNMLLETIHVGRAPGSPVVDEATHRVYVVNRGENTISVIFQETGGRLMPWIPLLLLND